MYPSSERYVAPDEHGDNACLDSWYAATPVIFKDSSVFQRQQPGVGLL